MAFTLGVGPSVANTGSGTSLGVTLVGTTAGRSVIIGVCWESSAITLDSVTCSGESVNLVGTPASSSGQRAQLAYVSELAGGGSKTFTANFSSSVSGAGIFAIEFAGGYPASFLDTSVSDTGTSANPSTSISTGANNCLIVGIEVNSSGSPTVGSGYTNIAGTSSWTKFFKAQYNLDAGSAGSKTVDWVNATSNTWIIQAASFNTLSASPTITPGAGTLVFAGDASSVGGDRSATPVTGTLALTGVAPTVSTSMSPVIVPASADLVLTGYASAAANSNSAIAEISLPVHTLSAEGYGGPYASITLPVHAVSATGEAGAVSTANVTLLALELSAGGNETASITLLVHSLDASGEAGTVGSAGIAALPYQLEAVGLGNNVGTAANDLLYHSSDAQGLTGTIGTLEGTLAVHRLEATAFGGNVGTAAISLLLHTTSSAAFAAVTGTAAITLAGHYLEAAGFPTLAETYRTWALNLRNAALTEYDNFDFNSFAYFDGKYLAAGPGGIVELGNQDLDGEDKIGWRVRTG